MKRYAVAGPRRRRVFAGFTLIELMITVAIVAILLSVALPAYQNQVRKSKRALARSVLLAVSARQEHFFIQNKRYAKNLSQLGYSSATIALDASGRQLSPASANGIYLLSIEDNEQQSARLQFTVRADAIKEQLHDRDCVVLAITSLGVKSASPGKAADCW